VALSKADSDPILRSRLEFAFQEQATSAGQGSAWLSPDQLELIGDDPMRVEVIVKRIRLGANFAIFVLFFGVATLEAFQTGNWIKAAFWLAIGLVFLLADNLRALAGNLRNGG
jgi:hypothetical protein